MKPEVVLEKLLDYFEECLGGKYSGKENALAVYVRGYLGWPLPAGREDLRYEYSQGEEDRKFWVAKNQGG